MSDRFALAAVTLTIRNLLQEVAQDTIPGATVSLGRPQTRGGAEKDLPGLNLFLLRTCASPVFRNSDLPTRTANGTLIARPQVGLELEYLVSCYGAGVQPEILLGATVAEIHARPVLSKAQIAQALGAVDGALPGADEARDSNLPDQRERVRLSCYELTGEELARIWSTLLQVPYDLTFAVRASAAILEAPLEPTVLPLAKEPNFDVGASGVTP